METTKISIDKDRTVWHHLFKKRDCELNEGLLKYVKDKPFKLKDGGAICNKKGITKSGKRISNMWRKLLIKAGW